MVKPEKMCASETSQRSNKADVYLADQNDVIWPSSWQYAKLLWQLKKKKVREINTFSTIDLHVKLGGNMKS